MNGSEFENISMEQCFNEYSIEETLGGDDQWYCSTCKEHRDITKKLELWKTPKIMCIHLKRFTQRKGSNRGRQGMMGMAIAQITGNQKNGALVDYPIEGLDMRLFSLDLKDEPEPVYYDLYAVSNHYGSLNGGHYTATCKNTIEDKWYYFDDSRVTPASHSQIVSTAGYLLFYRRRE